jgi:integrase/recombinase XerD
MPKRKPKRLPTVLTSNEREAFLHSFNPKAATGLRNLCIVTVMLNTGLRVAECLNLRPDDIDWLTGDVMVWQGKGSKDRKTYLSTEDLTLLSRWRSLRPEGSEFLFTTLDGGKVDDRYVREMVKRKAVQAGIKKDIHPHTLRHTLGTDIYKKTQDLMLTARALGHSRTTTAEIYVQLSDEKIAREIRGLRA